MAFQKKDQGTSTKEAARSIAKSAAGASTVPATENQALARQPKDFSHSTAIQIQKSLESYQEQIVGILQDPRIAKSLLTTFSVIVARNPDLKKCTPKSLIGSLMQALILRLNIEPAIGHVYLIPRKNKNTDELEATFNLGYKGMISLAYRNPDVAKVVAEAVRENDVFEYVEGTKASLIHKRPKFGTSRGALVGAYAFVEFKSGSTIYRVMDREEIMKHKHFSQASNSKYSPWNARVNENSEEGDWEGSMWAKTPLRGLMNITPLSTDTTLGIASDEQTIRPEMFRPSSKPGRSLELDVAELEEFEQPKLDPRKEVKSGESESSNGSCVLAEGRATPEGAKTEPVVQNPQSGLSQTIGKEDVPAGPALPELKPPIAPPDGSMELGDAHEERDPAEILIDKMEEAQKVLKLTRDQFKAKMLKYGVNIDEQITGTRINAIIKVIKSMLDFHDPSK